MAEDLFAQRLRLIGTLTRLFEERGWELVVVGGSAVEFYTEGQYVSGDIDLCRRAGQRPIPPATERDVMRLLGASSTGTRRQWKLGEVFIDFLGEVETAPRPVFRELETPEGTIRLMPAEDVLVERVFVAQAQRPPQASTLAVARKMAVAAVAMGADFDWPKAYALAASRDYDVEQPPAGAGDRAGRKPAEDPPEDPEVAMKTRWTWAEWQAGRAARRARSEAVAPGPCGRAESSSDRRLRAAYRGRRAPEPGPTPGEPRRAARGAPSTTGRHDLP